MGERRASWAMARAIAASRNIFAPSIRLIAWYMVPAVAVRRSGTSPLISHVPRASCAQETAATAMPREAAASPARACPRRRAARAVVVITAIRAIAATPSARANMARAGPLRPANAATTWSPGAITPGFGAPSDTLTIQAAA
jgi:hypothetical protein